MDNQEKEEHKKVFEPLCLSNVIDEEVSILKRGRRVKRPTRMLEETEEVELSNVVKEEEEVQTSVLLEKEQGQEGKEEMKRNKKKKQRERIDQSEQPTPDVEKEVFLNREKKGLLEEAPQSDENNTRRKKRRKPDHTESEAVEVVRNMLQRMRDAADEDDRARAEGRPPISKLKLLGEACSEIAKPKWVNWYLRENVCDELARWLTVLPGGVLPNMTIRSRILQLLHKIPLSIEFMYGSQLGKRLIQLWKSPDELDENRILIRSLIQLLIRLMLNATGSRRSLDTGYDSIHLSSDSHATDPVALDDSRMRSEVSSFPLSSQTSNRLSRSGYCTTFLRSSFDANALLEPQPPLRESNSTMARLNRMISHRKFVTTKHPKRSFVNVSGRNKNPM